MRGTRTLGTIVPLLLHLGNALGNHTRVLPRYEPCGRALDLSMLHITHLIIPVTEFECMDEVFDRVSFMDSSNVHLRLYLNSDDEKLLHDIKKKSEVYDISTKFITATIKLLQGKKKGIDYTKEISLKVMGRYLGLGEAYYVAVVEPQCLLAMFRSDWLNDADTTLRWNPGKSPLWIANFMKHSECSKSGVYSYVDCELNKYYTELVHPYVKRLSKSDGSQYSIYDEFQIYLAHNLNVTIAKYLIEL